MMMFLIFFKACQLEGFRRCQNQSVVSLEVDFRVENVCLGQLAVLLRSLCRVASFAKRSGFLPTFNTNCFFLQCFRTNFFRLHAEVLEVTKFFPRARNTIFGETFNVTTTSTTSSCRPHVLLPSSYSKTRKISP